MATKTTTFSESNKNAETNTLSLTINIYFSANNSQTWFNGKTLYCTCNGVTQSRSITLSKGGSISESFIFDGITSGSTVSYSWNCETVTSVLGNISDSGTHTVSSIPRYATCNQSLNSKTSSSIKMNWSSDSTIDYVWYSINNGSSWVTVGSVNASSGSYNITGLSANTAYSIKTRVRRKDSQLTTDSSALSVTTYAKTTPTISLSSKTINSITVTSNCNVTVSSTQYRIKTSNGSYSSYQTSATFTGLQPNTSYTIEVKKIGTSSGEVGYATLNVITYQIALLTNVSNFNHGDNVAVSFSNASGCEVALCIVDKLTDSVICGYRNASGNSYTFVFSDSELDTMYKKFGNENSRVVRIYVRTYCNGVYYYNYKEVVVVLTGNQKTVRIEIDGQIKRAKVFVCINGQIKRAVAFAGVNGTARRCL